jgi:hypothetical protein
MRQQVAVLVVSGFLLACPGWTANAQPYPDGSSNRPDQMQQMQQRFERGRRQDDDDESEGRNDWRRPGYMERGGRSGEWRGRGMMDRSDAPDERRRRAPFPEQGGPGFGPMGMMGHPMGRAGMMEMMMILMDSDGDGAVSLQEFLAAHEKIFKAMDANKDGRLTLEELRNFRPGSRSAPPQ